MTPHIKKDRILAFVHIEKCAGTTLNHVLRKNFFPHHIDVRPLRTHNGGMFTQRDLESFLKINPFLKSISGHSVVPHVNLTTPVRFITVLRDPIKRYLSRYQYMVEMLNYTISYEEFSKHTATHNFQTKKIAGSASLSEAKRILERKFDLVGLSENFDLFRVMLENLLSNRNFDASYKRENVAATSSKCKDHIMQKTRKSMFPLQGKTIKRTSVFIIL